MEDATKEQEKETSGNMRKVLENEVDSLQEKRMTVEKDVESLMKDGDEFAVKAQKEYKLTVIATRGQSNLTKSASRGAHSQVRGHPRGSKVVPLNSWGRVSY